jgi:hypothetical protein
MIFVPFPGRIPRLLVPLSVTLHSMIDAYLADHISYGDLAEAGKPAAVFDFGNPQQRRDDGQGLVNADDWLIGGCSRLLEGCRIVAAALQRNEGSATEAANLSEPSRCIIRC